MSETVDIVICSGYSPGARVLRAAVREISKRRPIRVVTVAPALAGLPKAVEDMKGLKGAERSSSWMDATVFVGFRC